MLDVGDGRPAAKSARRPAGELPVLGYTARKPASWLSREPATRTCCEPLRLANAEDVLGRLEHGFDTRIGDRGITLSGGQRQRICLARRSWSQASVLGFDDATSALDAADRRRILDNIRDFKRSQGRAVTVLIVSSKLSTVLLADRVLVLIDGQLVAAGNASRAGAAQRGLP